jgi:hypothetical protein
LACLFFFISAWLVFDSSKRNFLPASLLSFPLPTRPLSSPRCGPPAAHNATSQLPISIPFKKKVAYINQINATRSLIPLHSVLFNFFIFLYSFNLLCLGIVGEKNMLSPRVFLRAPARCCRPLPTARARGPPPSPLPPSCAATLPCYTRTTTRFPRVSVSIRPGVR